MLSYSELHLLHSTGAGCKKKRAHAAPQQTVCTALLLLWNDSAKNNIQEDDLRPISSEGISSSPFFQILFFCLEHKPSVHLNLTYCHNTRHLSEHQWGWVGSFHPLHIFCTEVQILCLYYIYWQHPAPSGSVAGMVPGAGGLVLAPSREQSSTCAVVHSPG